jgi:hypothetical protein
VSEPTRRGVRTTEDFWVSLDLALPSSSEPSWHAFATYDLPRAVERFATEWETLPALIPGRPDYRLLVGNGTVVAVYAIEAQLARDDTVELVNITVHTTGLPALDEDPG